MQRASVLLFLLGFFLVSKSNSIFCPIGCPEECIPVTQNLTVLNPTNGVVYVDASYNETFSNGTEFFPFTSVQEVLESATAFFSDITILVKPGRYEFEERVTFDESSGLTLSDTAKSSYSRTITIKSTHGSEKTIFTCTGNNILVVSSVDPFSSGKALSIRVVFEGISFINCSLPIFFQGDSLEILNCLFSESRTSIALQYSSSVEIHNTTFLNHRNSWIEFLGPLNVIIKDCYFESENLREGSNGIDYTSNKENSQASIISSIFAKSSFSNTISVVNRIDSTFTIENCTFSNTKKITLSTDGNVLIKNSFFSDNHDFSYLAYGFSGNLVFEGCHFSENTNFQNGLIGCQETQISINECSFEKNIALDAFSLFLILDDSTFTLENSYIYNNEISRFYAQSTLYTTSFHVKNCFIYGNLFASLVSSTFSNFTFEDSIIEENYFVLPSRIESSKLFVKGSEFLKNGILLETPGCGIFNIYNGAQAQVESSYFINSSFPIGYGVNFCVFGEILVRNTTFSGGYGSEGSSIYCEDCVMDINDSSFKNEFSTDFGTLTILNPAKVRIRNCQFEDNQSNRGGAIWVETNSNQTMEVINCVFSNNYADLRGGALYSANFYNFPQVINSTFSKNSARLSGNDFAGPATSMQWNMAPQGEIRNSSGLFLPSFSVELKDSFGEKAFLSEEECLSLLVKSSSPNGEVFGEVEKAIINGEVAFSGLRLSGKEGVYEIIVESNSVQSFDPEIFRLKFQAIIETCPSGKVFTNIQESTFQICVEAICEKGCLNGKCVGMNNCSCEEGWAGESCSFLDKEAFVANYNRTSPMVIAIINSILLVINLTVAALILWNRESPVIKASSLHFCLQLIFGIILGHISVYTYMGSPSTSLCTANLWLVNLTFAICFSAITAKIWRIFRTSSNKQLLSVPLPAKEIIGWSIFLIGIELILVIVWTAGDTPGSVEKEVNFVKSVVCGSTNEGSFSVGILSATLTYNGMIVLVCSWLSTQVRKVRAPFKESLLSFLTSTNSLVISIVAIPLIYLSGSTFGSEAVFIVQTVGMMLSLAFGTLTQFGYKLFLIYFETKENLTKQSTPSSQRKSEINMQEKSPVSDPDEDDMVEQIIVTKMSMKSKYLRRWQQKHVEYFPSVGILTIFKDQGKDNIGITFDIKKCEVKLFENIPGCIELDLDGKKTLLQCGGKSSAAEWFKTLNSYQSKEQNLPEEDTVLSNY